MDYWNYLTSIPSADDPDTLRRLNNPGQGVPSARDMARAGYYNLEGITGAVPTMVGWVGQGAQKGLDALGYQPDPIAVGNQQKMLALTGANRSAVVRALLGDF